MYMTPEFDLGHESEDKKKIEGKAVQHSLLGEGICIFVCCGIISIFKLIKLILSLTVLILEILQFDRRVSMVTCQRPVLVSEDHAPPAIQQREIIYRPPMPPLEPMSNNRPSTVTSVYNQKNYNPKHMVYIFQNKSLLQRSSVFHLPPRPAVRVPASKRSK